MCWAAAHSVNGTVSGAEMSEPFPRRDAASCTEEAGGRSRARSIPARTELFGTKGSTRSKNSAWRGVEFGFELRYSQASAAATATATAPETASGCVCVTEEESSACSATLIKLPEKKAPNGATLMAEPLPKEPWPSKRLAAASRHGSPSRMRFRRRCIPAPYPRLESQG